MTLGNTKQLDEIFRLLEQQRQMLDHWPLTNEQIAKDKEISARIRSLIDQICSAQSKAGSLEFPEVDLTEPSPLRI